MFINSKPLVVIAGPTASGKSSIALKLASEINGVIINGDSRQIYKEIKIGTTRPNNKDMHSVPHYLYGHVSVKEDYNIYKYQKDVKDVLKNIPKDKIPILTGGTGLYIDSVVFNYKLKKNSKAGNRKILQGKSLMELQKLIDPILLKKLNESDRNNSVRLRRVIEKNSTNYKKGKVLNHIYIVIDMPVKILRRRIKERVDFMFNNGLLEENKMVRDMKLENYPALKTIGYQEFDEYFSNSKSLDEIKEEIVNHTNQYAKRQRTWFRRNKNAIWTNNYDYILEELVKFINT